MHNTDTFPEANLPNFTLKALQLHYTWTDVLYAIFGDPDPVGSGIRWIHILSFRHNAFCYLVVTFIFEYKSIFLERQEIIKSHAATQ
jgi:hypothetical protein